MTVGELTSRMSYYELLEWAEYYRADPFGEYREDVRHGILASLIANIHRKPRSRVMQAEEFYPNFQSQRIERIQKFRDSLKELALKQEKERGN